MRSNRTHTPSRSSWLDRPFLSSATLDFEKALYGIFIALAVLSRLWDLGQHILSHDETVHAQWSWYLFQGRGYHHQPLSHGPFLFHSTALNFYLFGDNEFSARLVPAVLGVVLVAFPYAFRRWLGRSGALVASFLFLISPSLLYYARYARNDVPIVVWSLCAVLAIFRYLEEPSSPDFGRRSTRWLIILAAALVLMLATKEVAFFYIAIFGLFLVLLFFVGLGVPHWKTHAWEQWSGILLTVLGLITIILLTAGLLLYSLNLFELFPTRYQVCGQSPVPGPRPGEMHCTDANCVLFQDQCQKPIHAVVGNNFLEFDQTGTRIAIQLTQLERLAVIVLISVIAVMAGFGAFVVMKHWMPFRRPLTGDGCRLDGECRALDLIVFIGTFTLPFLAHVAISGLSRLASRTIFGIDAAFDSLDYSEAGLLRSAGFVFILLGVSVAVAVWWDWRRWLIGAGVFYVIFVVLFTTVFTNGNGLATGMVGSLGYWLEQQAVERGSQPLYYYGLMVSLYEYLPLIGFVAAAVYFLKAKKPTQSSNFQASSTFILFLLFWAILTWPIYSFAGERMPWMTVHFVAPMILASGWIIGILIDNTDWRAVLGRGGWVVFLISPLMVAALVQTLSPWLTAAGSPKPFSGLSVGQTNATLQFLSALFVLLILAGVLYWIGQRIGGIGLLRALVALTLGVLAVLTIRTAWAFAYINYDNATEFLVYAHGAPDVRVVMEQIEDISQRISGARALDVGYTADGSYPFMWYLRNYPNATQVPNPPSRPDLDKSVIIAGDAEWAGIEPYLGDHYACNRYNFMWWPMQDYSALSWERIRHALSNAEMRGAVWDIVFRRDYRKYEKVTGKTVRLSNWPLRDGVRFCVQRDLMARMWGQKTGLAQGAEETRSARTDHYVGLEQLANPDLEIKALGPYGSLNSPHGMAVDAQGLLYVADTDNHRVVKFSSEGRLVATWESQWWRGLQTWSPNGCLDAAGQPLAKGDGEFCEPWGIAIGPSGNIYVADTWNHRIQVFTPEGEFLNNVGSFGQSGNLVSSAAYHFYGPRDLAVDERGNIFVSDTGNKRIQVFGPDFRYQRSFGGPGISAGRFEEPVGLAIGPDNLIYVADTWNHRVQVLTLDGAYAQEWSVVGWESQGVFNKPYVSTDSTGRVYVSDPEAARVIVFDSDGEPLAVLDLQSAGGGKKPLPVGVLLDANHNLWISDAANHRLLRFPPLEFSRSGETE